MQMSGTSNVCRKLQIMLEEQRGLLSAGEAQRETWGGEGGRNEGPAPSRVPPLWLWILHCACSAALAPCFLQLPPHIRAFFLSGRVLKPNSTLPLQFSFWGIFLQSLCPSVCLAIVPASGMQLGQLGLS